MNAKRFVIKHVTTGFAAAFLLVAVILAVDLASIRSLVVASEVGPLALGLLTLFLSLSFSSVQLGIAIMSIGKGEDDAGNGRKSG
jgi:hypothetical protein